MLTNTCWDCISLHHCHANTDGNIFITCKHMYIFMSTALNYILPLTTVKCTVLFVFFSSLKQRRMKCWSKVGQTARRSDEAWLAAKKWEHVTRFFSHFERMMQIGRCDAQDSPLCYQAKALDLFWTLKMSLVQSYIVQKQLTFKQKIKKK